MSCPVYACLPTEREFHRKAEQAIKEKAEQALRHGVSNEQQTIDAEFTDATNDVKRLSKRAEE